ncbi:MAG: hypothetical protein KC800_22090, partial [Candidatus Eremiobacteraeota bacterium]|nr:hypothetical protein [Candidatus Eremiobacteraeota bacterium]
NALDSDNWGDLNQEQKIVKRTLLDLTRSDMKIGSVKMTADTSKVFAEVVDHDSMDQVQVGYLKQEFKEKTGRELIITDTSQKKRKKFEVAPPEPEEIFPRPRPIVPVYRPYHRELDPDSEEEDKKKKDSAIEHMKAKDDSDQKPRESRIYLRSRPSAESSGLEIPSAPPKKDDAPGEKDESDTSIKKLKGRPARPKSSGGGGPKKSQSGGGGGSRTQSRSKPRRATEEKELKKERSDGKEKELGGLVREKLDTETGLKISLVRMDLTEQADDPRGEGGGSSSACATCGTELPEAQAQNCPICAQAGQDIMALTKTNYRFAGVKLFATADTVVASAQAKDILQQGMLTSVASLRYWPKLPGHKEILRLRAQ